MSIASGSGHHRSQTEQQDLDDGDNAPHEPVSDVADDVVRAAEDLIDAIDEVLRDSLGLDVDASEEEFEERARAAVAGYVQKGGQ
jgi:hypothetical protein